MELFDVALLASPAGIVLAIVAAVWFRSGWPVLAALLGVPIGGLLGRWSWEWFAEKPPGVDFGSEFEGFDWVIGFASVGLLVAAVLGSALAANRRGRGSVKDQAPFKASPDQLLGLASELERWGCLLLNVRASPRPAIR